MKKVIPISVILAIALATMPSTFAGGREKKHRDPGLVGKALTVSPETFDPMQGRVHRGNQFRDGVHLTSGVLAQPQIAWKFKTGGRVRSSPVVVEGVVYIGSSDGCVYALDAATGKEKWKYEAGVPVYGSAAVDASTVFIASETAMLCLDKNDGSMKWSTPFANNWKSDGSPAILHGAVLIGSGGKGSVDVLNMSTGPLLALDKETGKILWQGSAGPQGYAAIATDGTQFFCGANGSGYNSFDVATGKMLQKLRGDHQGRQWNSISLRGSSLYVPVGIRGCVAAFENRDGKQILRWFNTTLERNKEVEMNGGGIFGYEILSDLAATDKVVLAGCNDNSLYCFSADKGDILWKFPTEGKIQSSPSIAGETAYFGSWDGSLYAIDITTGKLRWSLPLGERIFSSPWPADAAIYIGCDDGFLYCLK